MYISLMNFGVEVKRKVLTGNDNLRQRLPYKVPIDIIDRLFYVQCHSFLNCFFGPANNQFDSINIHSDFTQRMPPV